REGARAHVVQHGFASRGEARGAVGHESLALRGADLLAQIGPPRAAELALAAFGCVKRDHVVAGPHARDTGSHLLDDASALVAENRREQTLRVAPGQCEGVGVADPGRDDLDQDLAGLGGGHVHFLDRQWPAGRPRRRTARGHALLGAAPATPAPQYITAEPHQPKERVTIPAIPPGVVDQRRANATASIAAVAAVAAVAHVQLVPGLHDRRVVV